MLSSVPPLVSAIVLTYRSPKDTLACVRALLAQSLGDRLEVIVVDNHSDTDSIGILRTQLPPDARVRIVETRRNVGFGRGYAAGAHSARGAYIFINNPVKIAPPDALERLVAKMEAEPDIGILSPKLQYPNGMVRLSPRSFPLPIDVIANRSFLGHFFQHRLTHYLQLDLSPDAERDVDWVAGGCMLMPRVLFEQLGGFDHRFFLFFEDTDLCRRCWQAGKRVTYFPAVVVADRQRRLSEGGVVSLLGTRVGRAHLLSAVKYFWKWRGVTNKRMAQ